MRGPLFLFLLLPLAGCLVAERAPIDPASVQVPAGLAVSDDAYRAAYVFAATRVGRADFDLLYAVNRTWTGPAVLQPDCDTCGPLAHEPHDWVAFDLVVHGQRHAGPLVRVWPDGSIANRLEDQPHYGLPDCRQRPASCRFFLDADEARRVAQHAGLQPRGCPLTAFLGWSADAQRFAWQVQDEPCPTPESATGETYVIDAATGQVLKRSEWFYIAD